MPSTVPTGSSGYALHDHAEHHRQRLDRQLCPERDDLPHHHVRNNSTITGVSFGSYILSGSVNNFSLTVDGTAYYNDQFKRAGSAVSAYYSTNGTTWTQLGATQLVGLNAASLGGLAVTSGNNTATNQATFQNVAVNGSAVTGIAPDIHPQLMVSTLDNLGETTAMSSYDGDTTVLVDGNADGVPDHLDSGKLRRLLDEQLR